MWVEIKDREEAWKLLAAGVLWVRSEIFEDKWYPFAPYVVDWLADPANKGYFMSRDFRNAVGILVEE